MTITQFVKDYAATIYANKVLAIGYGLMAASIALGAQNSYDAKKPQYIAGFAGSQIICFTTGGAFTFRTIRRTREHIQTAGTIDERFQQKHCAFYCNAVAVEHVAQEHNMEELLTPIIKKRATVTDAAKKWAIPAALLAANAYYLM